MPLWKDRGAPAGREMGAVVASNIRRTRRLQDWNQAELAERMNQLGYPWSRATMSDVERANRNLTIDEVAALAIALGVAPLDLLAPPDDAKPYDFGTEEPVAAKTMAAWWRGDVRVRLVSRGDGDHILRFEPRGDATAAVFADLGVPVNPPTNRSIADEDQEDDL